MQNSYINQVATSIINNNEDKQNIDVQEVAIGRKVKHSKFGMGTVVAVSKSGEK